VLEVSDPFEASVPPAGLVRVEDLETGRAEWVDLGARRPRAEWRAGQSRRARRLGEAFIRGRAGRIALTTDAPVAPALIRHFEARARRR
jgi:hypothetical protein